jgi:hypothetical protein
MIHASSVRLWLLCSILSFVLAQDTVVVPNVTYVGAKDVQADWEKQYWSFEKKYRCRLLAHRGWFLVT